VKTFLAETVIEKDGLLRLEHVPFQQGQTVHVFVSLQPDADTGSLKGTVLKYELPFAPAEEWDATQ
jgi:hypothetical protein